MPSKGFLVRGTLRPSGAGMAGMGRTIPAGTGTPKLPKQPNRVPSSITLKRNPGNR